MSNHRLVDSFKVRAAYDMVIVGVYTRKGKNTNKRREKDECCCKLTIDVMSPHDFNDAFIENP